MVERREGTDTSGRGLGHSWADDNVERGEEGADFVKRRPTYPIGDNPRGREIDFEATDTDEAYGSTRNPVVRAYRGKAPLEGQEFGMPARVGSLDKISDLRPALPTRSVDTAALDIAKETERAALAASDFGALFPTVTLNSPSPGATFSPGDQVTIKATVTDLRNIHQSTLQIDGQFVDRRVLDRREQDSTKEHQFIFIYDIPSTRALGAMEITVRGFNMATAAQGMIADDAINDPPQSDGIQTGVGSIKTRLGQSEGSQANPPQLDTTGLLRTPEGVTSITVNIV